MSGVMGGLKRHQRLKGFQRLKNPFEADGPRRDLMFRRSLSHDRADDPRTGRAAKDTRLAKAEILKHYSAFCKKQMLEPVTDFTVGRYRPALGQLGDGCILAHPTI